MAHRSNHEAPDGRRITRSGTYASLGRLPIAGEDFPRDRVELERMLATERDCRQHLEKLRWPSGFVCPSCAASGEPWTTGTGLLACQACRAPVLITRGTLFQRPSAPLSRWLRVLWEVADREGGMTSSRVQEILGCSTIDGGTRCLDAVRELMGQADDLRLVGPVGLGRTSIELSAAPAASSWLRKALVAIAVEHSCAVGQLGPVRLRHLGGSSAREVLGFAHAVLAPGCAVHTAPWRGYAQLGRQGFEHHPRGGDAGTAWGVEHVASLLELWLWSQNELDDSCLQGRLDEFAFRYNHRTEPSGLMFHRLVTAALWQGAGSAPVASQRSA